MVRTIAAIWLCFAAGGAAADQVGVPSGCTVVATLVAGTCEVSQVLSCEAGGPTPVDVYADGVFVRQEAYATLPMVYWRQGNLVQELEIRDGRLDFLSSMPVNEVRTVAVTRIRRQLGAEGGPPPADFDLTLSVVGPSIRELPGGGDREVRRYRMQMTGSGTEAADLFLDYDPALGLPIWRQGTVTGPDGTVSQVDDGVVAILLPGEAGFMEDRAPNGAACTAP